MLRIHERSTWGRAGAASPNREGGLVLNKLMNSGNGFQRRSLAMRDELVAISSLHAAWRGFIRYCAELKHSEIERLKIQDGLPVIAEVTRQKIKFPP